MLLFTELPRALILGNRASGIRGSGKLPGTRLLGKQVGRAVVRHLLYPSSSRLTTKRRNKGDREAHCMAEEERAQNADRGFSGSSNGESIPQLAITSPPTATPSASPPPSPSSKPLAPIPGSLRSSSSPPERSWPSPSSQPWRLASFGRARGSVKPCEVARGRTIFLFGGPRAGDRVPGGDTDRRQGGVGGERLLDDDRLCRRSRGRVGRGAPDVAER